MVDEGYKSIEIIHQMHQEYESWVAESMGEFKRTTPDEDRVKERI
jgi:hypothetical protein